MKIKDLPWFDRPGERLTQKSVEVLSSSDFKKTIFLALFFFSSFLPRTK